MSPRRYGPDYRETLRLRNGSEVELRLLLPSDKALVARGLSRLSRLSQYRRFFTAKDHLSASELHYLTELDGEGHFALGAVARGGDGQDEGVAVARFIRDLDEPARAEPAVTVIDDFQNLGLGRLLCVRLVEAARERGVRRFRSEVLADNQPMRELLHSLAPDATVSEQDGVVVVEIPLPDASPDEPAAHGPIYRILALAAHGLIGVRRAFDWIEHFAAKGDAPADAGR